MSRYIIIGDVHGCIEELNELLNKLNLKYEDTVVFVGDLIHKGPESNKCFVKALSLGANDNDFLWKPPVRTAITVMGNHEEKHARYLRTEQRSGPNLMKHTEGFAEAGLSAAAIGRLDNMPLWYQFWSGGHPFVVTHGGFPPGIEYLPSQEELLAMSKNKRSKYAQVLRTRFVTQEGKIVKLGKEQNTDSYWADLYDGRFGHCFFGHQVFHQDVPREYKFATALDLGCVHGGYLCAAIVQNGQVTYETVQAHKAHAKFVHWAKRRPT